MELKKEDIKKLESKLNEIADILKKIFVVEAASNGVPSEIIQENIKLSGNTVSAIYKYAKPKKNK